MSVPEVHPAECDCMYHRPWAWLQYPCGLHGGYFSPEIVDDAPMLAAAMARHRCPR